MSYILRSVPITTNGSGVASAEVSVGGCQVLAVAITLGTLSTPDIIITDEPAGVTLFAVEGLEVDLRVALSAQQQGSDGEDLTGAFAPPVALGRIHIAVAGAGNAKTGRIALLPGALTRGQMTLLTPDEFRELEPTQIGDAALGILLDAAEQEITDLAGSLDERTEELTGGPGIGMLVLSPPADEISAIVERHRGGDVSLETDDWFVTNGRFLTRLASGTNPRRWWAPSVLVTYVPLDNTATRKGVQLQLVRLGLSAVPGSGTERIGEYATNAGPADPVLARAAILSSLNPSPFIGP